MVNMFLWHTLYVCAGFTGATWKWTHWHLHWRWYSLSMINFYVTKISTFSGSQELQNPFKNILFFWVKYFTVENFCEVCFHETTFKRILLSHILSFFYTLYIHLHTLLNAILLWMTSTVLTFFAGENSYFRWYASSVSFSDTYYEVPDNTF
jgi:hypothetical protein